MKLFDAIRGIRLKFARWVDAFWGYDVFIAHRRADAAEYARGLYEHLTAEKISCFIDRVVYGPGDSLLVATRRHVAKSTLFSGTPHPAPAYRLGRTGNRRISRIAWHNAILSILMGGALPNPILQQLQPFFRIPEELPALAKRPSDNVLSELRRNLNGRRRDRTRLLFFEGAAGLLMILLVASVLLGAIAKWQQRVAENRLQVVRSQALAADARRQIPEELYSSLETSIDAFDISPSLDAQTALLEGFSQAPQLKRYFPCGTDEKAVGVALSRTKAFLALACVRYAPSMETTVSVFDFNGRQLASVKAAGYQQTLLFTDSDRLRIGQGTVSTQIDCFDEAPTGPYAAFETSHSNSAAYLEFDDLRLGRTQRLGFSLQTKNCSSLTDAYKAALALQTSRGYGPILLFHTDKNVEVEPIQNPLRDGSSGIRTVLEHARVSSDGQRLVFSSNGSSLGVFELPARRLIGTLGLPNIHAVSLPFGMSLSSKNVDAPSARISFEI